MVNIAPMYGEIGDGLWHCFTNIKNLGFSGMNGNTMGYHQLELTVKWCTQFQGDGKKQSIFQEI